ncbi:S-adenosyl-L-methionine-dependent methyltransferase [Sesbania bispinosa]|nr:S-adenosyl-L-methionine-dependent methyltransferase [Sesbania bispinosa]
MAKLKLSRNRETHVPLSSPSSPSLDFLRSPSSPLRPFRRPPSPSVCGRCVVASVPGPGCDVAASVPAPSAIYRSGFMCKRCKKTYSSKDRYLDLTVTAGLRDYTEVQLVRTELFRSPIVSFLYERGWRQNFRQSGFPGPDEEFKMAQEYFEPAQGGLIVDVSCGSGLFSRKFAKSGTYSGVIALDFYENMLRQCYDFIKKDDTLSTTNIALVRADVSRLPFSSGSVDVVHAGAALHCWPSPSNVLTSFPCAVHHYGIVYLIHEKHEEVAAVNVKIQGKVGQAKFAGVVSLKSHSCCSGGSFLLNCSSSLLPSRSGRI